MNNTFYRLPRPEAAARWIEQTPPHFLFAVKASRYLTHVKRLRDLGRGLERFYAAIAPLVRGSVRYTPSAEDAIAAVNRREAGAALLVRPPTVEQVRAVAERGDTMPQKSTYFYPKLVSGLLFLPL